MVQRVAIVGLGLIGGSLGLALVPSRGIKVTGYDWDLATMDRALKMGAVHQVGELHQVVAEADIVFLCTPINTIAKMAREIIKFCRPGSVLTDVGSTKQGIVEVFDDFSQYGVWGIGGHPMAGSERQGIAGADQYLFENAVYILTPGRNSPATAIEKLSSLLRLTGAHIIIMDAKKHDHLVALVSHLPHLVASALVAMLKDEDEALALAASGFRDTTRVASGDSILWGEILLSNRRRLADQVGIFIDQLKNLQTILKEQRSSELVDFLNTSREIREAMPSKRKGLVPAEQDLICVVPDRPGIIGTLGRYLGEKGINIADIEILRVREGDGGTIRISIGNEADGQEAVETLLSYGIKAWLRQ